jgi:hypothetical protein
MTKQTHSNEESDFAWTVVRGPSPVFHSVGRNV